MGQHHRTGSRGVFLQRILPYVPGGGEREKVPPIYFDTNNQIGGATSYHVLPGRSRRAYEFELPVCMDIEAPPPPIAEAHVHR